MAETNLISVAGGIINAVAGPLATEQFSLLWNYKKELEKLKSTVSTIKAVLEDAEAQQPKSHAVTDWLGKLADVLNEASGLLEVVSAETQQRNAMTQGKKGKTVCIFFFQLRKLVHDLEMANKMKDIREKLDAIKDERKLHL